MRFFAIDFNEASVIESDEIEFVPRSVCTSCGLKVVPISNRYLVPEDTVAKLVLHIEYDELPDMFQAASMLVAAAWVVNELTEHALDGFVLRPVYTWSDNVICELSGYSWIAVTGRCENHPVWHRVVSRCESCNFEKTESTNAQRRTMILKRPLPSTDFFRSREQINGIIVSERAKAVLELKLKSIINFKEIAIDK